MKAGKKRSGGASAEGSNACCSQAWCPWHNSGSRDGDCDGCAGNRRSVRAPVVQPRGGRGSAGGSVAVTVRKTRRGSVWREEPDANHVDFDDLLPPDACIIVEVPRVTTGLNVVNDIVQLMTDHFQELMRRGFLDMNKIAASLRATQRWSEWCGRDCLKNYRGMLGHILKMGGSSIDTVDIRPALECRNDMDMTDRLADESGCYLRVQNRKGETRATVMTSKPMSQMFMSGEELFEWARQTGLIYFAGLYNFIEPESIRDFLFAVGVQSFERATPTRVDMIIWCRTRNGDRMRCVATLVRQWKPIPDFLLRLWPLARDDKRQRHMPPAICAAADAPSLMSATPVYNSSRNIQEVQPQPPEPRTAALGDRPPKPSTVIIRDGAFASPALSLPQIRPHESSPPQLRPPEPPPPSSPRWSSSLTPSPKWSPNPPPLPQHLLEHLLTSAVDAKTGRAGNHLDQGGGNTPAAVVEPCSPPGESSLWPGSGVCPDGGQQQQQQRDVDHGPPPQQRQHAFPPVHLRVYSPVALPCQASGQRMHHHHHHQHPRRDLLREDMQVTPHYHPLQQHQYQQLPPDVPLDDGGYNSVDGSLRQYQQQQQQEEEQPQQPPPPIEYDLRHHLTHALFHPSQPLQPPSTTPPPFTSSAHPHATQTPSSASAHHVGQLEPMAQSQVSLSPLPVAPAPGTRGDLQTVLPQVDWDAMAALLSSPSAPSTPAIVPSDSPPMPAHLPPAMPLLEDAGMSGVSSTSSDGTVGYTPAEQSGDAGGGGVGEGVQHHHHQQQQQQHQQQQHVGDGDEQPPPASTAVDAQAASAVGGEDLDDVPLLNDDSDLSDIAADISLW